MRKPTHMQWAEHYARRARGCEVDARRSLECGNILDANRYTVIAERYRQMEAEASEKARWKGELMEVIHG